MQNTSNLFHNLSLFSFIIFNKNSHGQLSVSNIYGKNSTCKSSKSKFLFK